MSVNESIIGPKTFDFAVRIVNLFKNMTTERKEFVLSKQILRSGTSIGANVTEAQYAQSRPDFKSKMNIALKEAGETEYWLKLLKATDYLTEKEFKSLSDDLTPIIKMLIKIVQNSN